MPVGLLKKLYCALVICGFLLAGMGSAYAVPALTPTCLPHNDIRSFYPFSPPPQCVNTVSDVPAATLLLPYFEVDTAHSNGRTTIFTINNSSAVAVLAHVVIWSDLSVPVFNFNVYLTGFDTQIINLRDVLNGRLPQTASAGQDPSDTISPKGPFSQDINYYSCNGSNYVNSNLFSYPVLPPPLLLNAAQIKNMQQSLLGDPTTLSPNEILCAGANHQDLIARGYVTVDTVNNCTSRFPFQEGYLAFDGSGDATNQNDLTGEAYYMTGTPISVNVGSSVAPSGFYATSSNPSVNLVHIVAEAFDRTTSTSGQYTFYGRYDSWSAADNRQPLATSFMARFMNNTGLGANGGQGVTSVDLLSAGPQLIVWRDSKVSQNYFACLNSAATFPSWFPLGQEGIVAFDEQEHPQVITTKPFPIETQVVRIGSSVLPVTFTSGWLFLDLNTSVSAAGNNPSIDPRAAQAWVEVVDTYGFIRPAQHLDSATDAWHFVPGLVQ